jgi:hypothetical protein
VLVLQEISVGLTRVGLVGEEQRPSLIGLGRDVDGVGFDVEARAFLRGDLDLVLGEGDVCIGVDEIA